MAYSIIAGNSSGYFAINSSTGEITLHASGVGNLSGSYVLTRHDDVANTNQQITVNIKPNAITVDAAHPLTDTVGTDSYSWTLPKPTICFQFVDGTWGTVPPDDGLEITSWTPAPTTRSVTDYAGAVGNKAVDGAELLGNWTVDINDQGIDERLPNFVSGLRPSAPLTVTRGAKLLSVKSMNSPSYTNPATVSSNMRKGCHNSANVLTILDALPDTTTKYYCPGLFLDDADISSVDLIPQFDISDFPVLTEPPAVDMYGNSFTFDWDDIDGDAYFDRLAGYGIFRNQQVPSITSGIYEAWGTKLGMWKNEALSESAYNFDRHLMFRFLRQRANKTSDANAQAIADEIIQYTIHWDSIIEKALSASLSEWYVGAAHGGHNNTVGQLLLIGAWMLTKINTTASNAIAQRVYNRIILDAPDIMSRTHRQIWTHAKLWDATNRATSNFDGYVGEFTTATNPDTEVNFGTLDWRSEGLTQNTTIDRIPFGNIGLQFKITSGAAAGDTIYTIVDWTFATTAGSAFGDSGLGGDGWVVSPGFTNTNHPVTGDDFEFLVAPQATIDWCDEFFGGPLAGHNGSGGSGEYVGNVINANAYPRLRDVYAEQNMPQLLNGCVAMTGLECFLWSNGGETLSFNQKYKWYWERMRSTGPSLYASVVNGNPYYNNYWTQSLQALARHYVHGDAGFPDWDYYGGVLDAVTPTISAVSGDSDNLYFTSNYPFHRIYYVVTTSATAPSAAQVRAGDDYADADAIIAGSLAVSTVGERVIPHELANGTYYLHVLQDTPSNNTSAVATGTVTVGVSWTESVVSNGGTANLYKLSGLAYAASTQYGLLAIDFLVPTSWPSSGKVMFETRSSSGSLRIYLNFSSSGRLIFLVVDNSGTTLISWFAPVSLFAADTKYQLAISWDLATPVLQKYINGVVNTSNVTTLTAGTPDNIARHGIMNATNTPASVNVKYGVIRFDPSLTGFFDLSNSANLEKLWNGTGSVDPGDGSTIVGSLHATGQTAMALVMDGDAAWWNDTANNNKGYAGKFSLATGGGSFTDSSW